MCPFISYPDMKTKHPIEIIELGNQPDLISPKNFNCFKNIAPILRMLNFIYN